VLWLRGPVPTKSAPFLRGTGQRPAQLGTRYASRAVGVPPAALLQNPALLCRGRNFEFRTIQVCPKDVRCHQ
jgi:hypothetical protein